MTEEEFREFHKAHPGLRNHSFTALEWVPRISRVNRVSYEKTMRKQYPKFEIWEKDINSIRHRAGNRSEYYPVTYIYPVKDNEQVLGFDLGNEQLRKEAMEKSAATGKAVMTEALILMQGKTKNLGYIVFLPVYAGTLMPDTIEKRKELIRGFTLGVYTFGIILEKSLDGKHVKNQEIYIFPDTAPDARPVYNHIPGYRGELIPFDDNLPTFSQLSSRFFVYLKSADMAGNDITYLFMPAQQNYWRNFFDTGTFIILFGGFLAALLVLLLTTRSIQNQETIGESEERYRSLVKAMPDGIFVNREGKIEYLNDAMLDILAAENPGQVVGNHPLVFFHPDCHDIVKQRIAQSINEKRTLPPAQLRMVRLDGAVVDVETTASSFRIGDDWAIQVVVRDITERIKAEETLKASESRYRLIFDSAVQGIIIADPETGKFRFVNQAMCRLFGYTQEEFTMLSVADLPPAESLPEIISIFESMVSGEISSASEIPGVRKDGTRIFVDVSTNDIILEGKKYLIGFFIDATERVNSRMMLEKSEEQYRNLIENSHDLIQSVDADGRIIFVNNRWHEVLGYDENDIKYMNIKDVIHPDSLGQYNREFARIIEGEYISLLKPHMVTKDGRVLEMEGSALQQRLENGAITTNAFFIDVTHRNRLERIKSLRLAVTNIISRFVSLEESLEQVLASIGAEVQWDCGELWWYNEAGDILERVQSWSTTLRPELESFISISSSIQFHPGEGLPGQAWLKRTVIWYGKLDSEPQFVRKETASLAGLKSAVAIPLIEKEITMGVMLLFGSRERPLEDELLVTLGEIGIQVGMFIRRKKLEDELEEERNLLVRRVEERTSELNEATIAAEAANKAKSDFLASMSHELRTPLNSVIGFSELMLNGMAGNLNEDQREFLGDIYDSGKHLLSLINDILDLSKVEAGKMELELSSVSIREVLNTVRSLFKEKTLQHGIAFNIDSGVTDEDDTIYGDERKLKQILMNLVSNAVKFTPDGGSIDIRVDLVTESGNHFVKFMVKDSGIGISSENLTRLFKPFQQLDNTSTRRYAGTGLGLSLCKGYTELHGGSIWVESEENRGATFSFTIPYVISEDG